MVQTRSSQSVQPTRGTYRAKPKLTIEGQDAPKKLMDDLLQIVVEESLHLPGMFTLVIQNDYFPGRRDEKPWRYKDLLQIGKSVEIGFAASTTDAQDFSEKKEGLLIKGEITAIETHFSERSQAPIIVRGYDTMHRLHRGQYNRSFQNVTDKDIVKKIAEEVGIKLGKLDDSGEPHDYVFQSNQTNMEFLRERANRIGFELFNQDGKLHFRKPNPGDELNLKWLKDVSSFWVRMTSAEQVKEVEVRGWDYAEKRAIVSTKQSQSASVITNTKNGKGSETSTKFSGKPPTPKRIVVDQPVFKPKQADQIAQAMCDELGGQFICADANAEGNPKIRPGRVIKLEELGTYSGKYYVTETRHVYQERVYRTEFCVRGLRGGDLLTTLAPKSTVQPGQTLLVGIVTDNNDSKGWGRVKVKFPTLTEDHNSNWARVVSIGAGKDRGFDCLPEINDEVLVAFEHGDIHRPYIIGNVWNGKDAPPEPVTHDVQNGTVRLRTFKTRIGHVLQFIEEDAHGTKAGVDITTAGGHKVHLTDSETAQEITITTSGGHQVHLKDTPQPSIAIQTIAGQSMTFNDTGLQVTIQTEGVVNIQAAGEVGIETGGAVNVEAGGAINLEAGGEISIVAGGAVNIEAAGEVSMNAAGLVSIDALGELNLASVGAITMEAVGAINLAAASISMEAASIALLGFGTIDGIPII